MTAAKWLRTLAAHLMGCPVHRRGRRRPTVTRLEDRLAPAALVGFDRLSIDRDNYDPGHVLVRLRDADAASRFGQSAQVVIPGLNLVRVDVAAGEDVPSVVARLRARPDVAYAEPDYIVHIAQVPNDPSFGSLWGFDNTGQTGGTPGADIRAPAAWDVTTGTGQTVVAVIDSGMDYTHPDLYLNVWINPDEIPSSWYAGPGLTTVVYKTQLQDTDGDGRITFRDLNHSANANLFTDLNGNGVIDAGDLLATTKAGGWADGKDNTKNGYTDDLFGWNFVAGSNNPLDDHGHGSHVSGTIGAIGNNGVGVVGLNWNTRIMPLKFLAASGSGSILNAIQAINYAAANGARVSNNSWGSFGYSQSLSDAIQNAAGAGHVFVAAAGNANYDIDPLGFYPGGHSPTNIIAVASSDHNDNRSSFSSFGRASVDLAAPGSSILSTWKDGGYNTISGTSMATPHVAGAVSLLLDQNPSWTVRQVRNRLLGTVDSLPAFSDLVAAGGRLNVHQALVGPTDVSPPTFLGATFLGAPTTVSSVRLTFSERIDPDTLAANVQITRPGGTVAPLGAVGVPGSDGTAYDVTFPAQLTSGNYTVTVGTGVTDLAGNKLAAVGSGTGTVIAPPGSVFTSSGLNAAIPSPGTLSSKLNVNSNLTINDVSVRLSILHTWVGDLVVTLSAPSGQTVTLFNRHGSAWDNINGVVFDDQAGTSITAGAPPYSAAYQPFQALAAFQGKSAKGFWTLNVQDAVSGETGRLTAWSLVYNSGGIAGQSGGSSSGGGGSFPGGPQSAVFISAVNGSASPWLALAEFDPEEDSSVLPWAAPVEVP